MPWRMPGGVGDSASGSLPPPDSTSTPDEATLKKAYQASADDLELVEDLDLVLALLENDDHAS